MKNRSEEASCSRCANRTDEIPPFCTWMGAEISQKVADDPTCEGFTVKGLRTNKDKARIGVREKIVKNLHHFLRVMPLKSDVDRVELPKTRMHTTCPKTTPDKSLILAALELKKLKGSIVLEHINCGKRSCHCQRGSLHPANYLHYYSNGKVRRRYLTKTMSTLLANSREELEKMLLESEAVLGQQGKGSNG
jgi:hypothetical protein